MEVDERLIAELESILTTDFSDPVIREARHDGVYAALAALDAHLNEIKVRANGYPQAPIDGAVWFAGRRMIDLTGRLTLHFRAAGWLRKEFLASWLWGKATLAVCAHCHHMVGPAMLACADCHERLGEPVEAIDRYEAVIDDFMWLLDEWEPETTAPVGDDRVAIECLQCAVERLLVLDSARSDAEAMRIVLTRIDRLFALPVTHPG
ncbi:hypothetical protein [Lysobacter hankyongensis]|uniref:Uncharacterized protein n=1 Tax=Lysobacter hankyongensis TaxID=1176535 RepID=A0ABP9B979_9GAMM